MTAAELVVAAEAGRAGAEAVEVVVSSRRRRRGRKKNEGQ